MKGSEEAHKPHRIDVHSHMFPPDYVKGLHEAGVDSALGVHLPEWSVEGLLEAMDGNDIEVSVVGTSSPAANVPDVKARREIARTCNEFAAKMIKDHPQRLGAFATLPLPDVEGSLSEIDYALGSLKLDGVGLLTNYNLKYLGDSSFEEVFRELNRRKAVVHIHPGDPPGHQFNTPSSLMDGPFDTTRTVTNLICTGTLERYPGISIILSHGGGTLPYLALRIGEGVPFMWPGMPEKAPKGFDYYLRRLYYDTAIVGAYAMPSLQRLAGTSHVVFATDYPFVPDYLVKKVIKELETYEGFDGAAKSAIDEKNARSLFPRFRAK